MKVKTKLFFIPVSFSAIGFICFFMWIIIGMVMGVSQNQINHYKDDSNYNEISCEIVEKTFRNETYKEFEIVEGNEHDSRYDRIGLWAANDSVVTESGFWSDIQVGDTVFIIATTGYFWDDYIRPIVGLRTEDKVYLDFEAGKANTRVGRDENKIFIYFIADYNYFCHLYFLCNYFDSCICS